MTSKKKSSQKHERLSTKIVGVLVSYAKTQLVLILIVTLLSWFALSRLNVQFPLLLALITGSAAVVPVLGMMVSAVIAGVVSVLDSTRFLPNTSVIVDGIAVVIAYGVINVIVDYFLAPYLIGKTTGIHPVILLGLVILGASAFGVLGAILTVPAVLVIKTILEEKK